MFRLGLAMVLLLWGAVPGLAADLTIDLGTTRTMTTAELLALPGATTITVPGDVSFDRTMTYHAVPLSVVLGGTALPDGQDLKLTASDGFVTDLPAADIVPPGGKGSIPWLAIETPDAPWPKTPDGKTAGPFYLIWVDPAASGIMREQWPFAIVSLGLSPSTITRWPQLSVGPEVPDPSPIRSGQKLVMTQCMVCHPVAKAGDAAVGPDLQVPKSPTEYFQPWALKAYIRDPASLRTWANMQMTSFPPDVLSDEDIDAIIAYLGYLAEHRT